LARSLRRGVARCSSAVAAERGAGLDGRASWPARGRRSNLNLIHNKDLTTELLMGIIHIFEFYLYIQVQILRPERFDSITPRLCSVRQR
jgi:hypothetical protein